MAKHKILHLITRLPIGGAERLLIDVLRNLDPTQFESEVCCIQARGELASEIEEMGIVLHNLGRMRSKHFDLGAILALRQLIRERRIDLVHSHLYHANLYGRIAAWREQIPVVASVHNTYTQHKWHRRLVNRLLARVSFCVTAPSADVELAIRRYDHVAAEKVVRLVNCIDLDRVTSNLEVAAAKRWLSIEPDDVVIGTVGRMEEQKGHGILLHAFAALRGLPGIPVRSLRLLIVGDGRLRQATEARARQLGIVDACRFPGSVTRMADVYRAIDVFVMPSLWEGLSLAMLEAMAAGLPLVATDVGGVRDVLGDNLHGRLVPPGDATSLAHALAELLRDTRLRQELAASASQRVRDTYGVANLTRQLSNLYEMAVHAHKNPL